MHELSYYVQGPCAYNQYPKHLNQRSSNTDQAKRIFPAALIAPDTHPKRKTRIHYSRVPAAKNLNGPCPSSKNSGQIAGNYKDRSSANSTDDRLAARKHHRSLRTKPASSASTPAKQEKRQRAKICRH